MIVTDVISNPRLPEVDAGNIMDLVANLSHYLNLGKSAGFNFIIIRSACWCRCRCMLCGMVRVTCMMGVGR